MTFSTPILLPPTPFERRMEQLGRMFPPPPSHPAHQFLSTQAKLSAERNLTFRRWVKDLEKKFHCFVLTRMQGGTQFPIADILRHYFLEYASRLAKHGPHSFPTSFNVIESFLIFSHDYFIFDLREERDHLLQLTEYIDWYSSGAFPDEPGVLTEIAAEGVIYSYNMVAPTEDYRIQTNGSELVITGVALVRHSTEVSMIALCGETPANVSDEKIPELGHGRPAVGKEGLESDGAYSITDRYLKETPGYSRVIGLVRFDLESRQFFVRYLNHDIGDSYLVATDDPMIFTKDITQQERDKIFKLSSETLIRYEPLFALLLSLMYLPAFFIGEHDRVTQTTFSTELHTRRASTEVRKAVRNLGRKFICFSREVHCLQSTADDSIVDERTIVPPDLEFAASGFWKTLAPGEIGEDEKGNPIVGKTWVQRTETWSSHGVEKFVMRKKEKRIEGANPGHLYIMRSGSHSLDIYKIGKTRRSPEVRARELTGATGVPTSFEVLATWEVGDVDLVEKEIHRRLRRYEVNRRREFFRAPLSVIVAEIEIVIRESI